MHVQISFFSSPHENNNDNAIPEIRAIFIIQFLIAAKKMKFDKNQRKMGADILSHPLV
jgi:hypothetical protein